MNQRSADNRTGRARRLVAVVLTCGLVVAGCGNRTSTGGSSNLNSSSTTAGGTGTSSHFGTLASPCGPGDAKGATDKGVSDSKIDIGVIFDNNAGAVRVPTAGVEASAKAFVEYCNAQGGINGRKLQLKGYDAKLLKSQAAAKQACDDQPFALVGNGVVQDAAMAQPLVDCGLVSVSAYTATFPMSVSPLNVSPIPNPGTVYATGEAKYIAKRFPQAIKKAAMFAPTASAAFDQAKKIIQARTQLGYKFVYENNYPLIQTDWKTQVQTLKNKGIQYVTMVDTANAAVGMLQAMHDADYHPKVVDLGQQYYDSDLAKSGVANGVFVQTNTQPFENPSPAISQYVEWLKKADPKSPVTTLGVQGFSAGLLFATAAKELGSNLTRKGLLDELHKIHTWTGGGLHPVQNPGANKVNTCTKILTVKNGKFVNVYPAGTSNDPTKSFVCNPNDVVKTPGNWGPVPKVK